MSIEYALATFLGSAVILFVSVSGYKLAKIARLPLNVRWEVYPVPHEAKGKRGYGGSYMEELNWAAQKRTSSRWAALAEIAVEVATLKRVRLHNRYGIWPLSLAMHWGLYLYFGWLVLLAVSGMAHVSWVSSLLTAVGLAAHGLGALGALGLALRRATHRDLAPYTTPLDYFNLLFIASFFVAGIVGWLGTHSFAAHQACLAGVLRFHPTPAPGVVWTSFVLFGLFLIYMPFTKLLHYFAKYFTFDRALWDDDFKTKGSVVDRQVAAQLGCTSAWAAPHIGRGQSWLEQAQDIATPGGRK